MSTAKRVAVGLYLTECNHLGGPSLTLQNFERNGLFRGDQLLDKPLPAVLRSMIATLREAGQTVTPLIKAEAFCGGPITSDAYATIRHEMLTHLERAMPVDGVLLALHGSATADDVGDTEGDLLGAVRAMVGPDVPIVATLDHHAHVTEAMVQAADALLAWETYPHDDTAETGVRGARMMLDILAGKCRPTMALAKVPVLVSGIHGQTEGEGPFADLMRRAKALEDRGGVLSTSMLLVHPYLDLPDMGGGAIVITDNDVATARTLADELAAAYWQRRRDFDPPFFTPAEAIRKGMAIEGGPVILLEAADCVGGGAAGDSVATLKALLEVDLPGQAFVPVVDRVAAEQCHAAGEGATVTLPLGHTLVPKWGKPVTVTAKVARLHDGRFTYDGGYLGGMTHSMGTTAVLEIGAVRVLVMSEPTYDWADEQFRAVGMDVRQAKFVVVKNPMNYRFGYAGVMKAALVLDTPGPTPAVLHHAGHKHVARPYYPLDSDVPDMKPRVYSRMR